MTDDELLLPSGAVLLHIGPYKTGSTAIQSAMFARRDEMDQYGVSYPGNWRRLFHIGHALLRWAPRAFQVPDVSRWDDFAADVRATTDRRVCISTEDFGRIREPERTRKIVQDLGADRLHVIAVARAYHRLLPSQWQERVKSHGVDGYDEWLRLVLGDDEEAEAHRSFRTSHDVAWMTSMWLPHLPPERFTIVVTDDSDRGLLPRTFEQMLGLPDGFLTLDDNSNASLSFEATEMLRGVNEVFERQGWSAQAYTRYLQRGLVPALQTGARSPLETSIPPLPAWARDAVLKRSEERIQAIRDSGVNVVGDLEAPAAARGSRCASRGAGRRRPLHLQRRHRSGRRAGRSAAPGAGPRGQAGPGAPSRPPGRTCRGHLEPGLAQGGASAAAPPAPTTGRSAGPRLGCAP